MNIPAQYAIDAPFHHNSFLINGEITLWDGPTADVYSSIHTPNSDGALAPTHLGSVPDMNAANALKALEAASNAFDKGKGGHGSDGIRILIGIVTSAKNQDLFLCPTYL